MKFLYHTQQKLDIIIHSHLETIYNQLKPFQLTPAIEFSIFYHDIVYKTQERDNEEKSAMFAKKRLKELGVADEVRKKVSELIMETKKHKASSCDNALFLEVYKDSKTPR